MSSADVAQHYNRVAESSIASRADSRAFYLRNFNNWVKSALIGTHLRLAERHFRSESSSSRDAETSSSSPSGGLRVMDLCCGKGGDLLKWRKGGVRSVAFVDVAEVSLDQCRRRYREMEERADAERRRGSPALMRADFQAADATAARLRDLRPDWPRFHLVSCQFSLHYCFQSYPAARQFVRNACESLLPGGYFVGTIPDACEIVRRLRRRPGPEAAFGNDVFSVAFSSPAVKTQQVPLFGCKYHFSLEKQVQDCPEYLVYFPVLEELCSEYGLRCVLKENFADFYRRHVAVPEWRRLLGAMQGLEPHPCAAGVEPKSRADGAYYAAEARLRERPASGEYRGGAAADADDPGGPVGTLSREDWEAATLYMAFAFQRRD